MLRGTCAGRAPSRRTGQCRSVRCPGVITGIGVGLQEALVITQQVVKTGGLATGMPLIEDIALDSVARGMDHPEVSGGAFASAGIEVADRGFVGLEIAALKQTGMNEFVEGLADIGGGAVPMAEGVAGELNAVALANDALSAVVRAVMAVFGGQHVGHQAGVGAEAQRGRRGCLHRNGVGIADADVDGAGQAADENDGGLIVVTVGGDALDLAEGCRDPP